MNQLINSTSKSLLDFNLQAKATIRGEGESENQFGLIPPKFLTKLMREWKKAHDYEPRDLAELLEGALE